jgi:GNAT superfamily N-acetyltransferase
MNRLTAALAFDRSLRTRAATRTLEIPGGVVARHDRLPSKWALNLVMLDAPLRLRAEPDEITKLAERHLGDLRHRHVMVDDAGAAARLAPALIARGWRLQRVVYMAWDGRPLPDYRRVLARRIPERAVHDFQLALSLEERGGHGGGAELAHVLAEGERAVRAGSRSVAFGAGERGRVSASSTLFLERPEGEGGLALIDEVGTLLTDRRRGLGRAVVVAALDAALRSGCDPVVIPADVDDWPRSFYERLGFEPLGVQHSFVLEPR